MSAKPNLTGSISMTSLNPDAFPKCTTHRKRLKFFCTKHELLLCSVCAVKRHRTCDDVLTLNEASEDKRTEGRKILEVYNQSIALVENAIVERKAAKKLLDSNAQEIQHEIHEVTQRLIDLVKHEERTLLENLQSIQNRENEALDKDISGLEVTYDKVKNRQETLTNNLKLTEADLIHAVIKERQQSDDNMEVATIVKKSFREIDFKFIVSPHVTSFLKHFKVLGQVMLSEDSNNNSSRSISLSSLSSIPSSPSSVQQRNENNITRQSRPNSDETQLSARERWSRDRLAQLTQRHSTSQPEGSTKVSPTEAGNIFQFGQFIHSPENRQMPTERRQLPMRALPRPSTPEVYDRQRNGPQRRDFVARPVSTPPTQSQMYGNGPQVRDVDRPQQSNVYRYVKAEPVNFSDNGSQPPPSSRRPFKAQADTRGGGQGDVNHSEPTHVMQTPRQTMQEYPGNNSQPEERPPSRAMSMGGQNYSRADKEDDVNFGRTFAAVQVSDRQQKQLDAPPTQGQSQPMSPRSSRTMNEVNRDRLYTDPPPYQYRRPNSRQSNGGDSFYEQNRQMQTADSVATDEEKGRRWIHQTSFNSNGIGSKRLITGIGIMRDGRIVVVDQEQYTVQLYDRNCKFVSEFKLESRPFDVAVISDTKIVVSLQTERVMKFMLITGDALTPVADLGVPCDLVCYGVCRGGGHYCVCCGDEIWILSDEGRVKNRIKHDKMGSNLFVQAEYVCMDATGNTLFVSDAGNNKIIALTIDGKRVWEFTYQGFKPSGLKFHDNFLYICDRDQHRMLMLNVEGQVVRQSVVGRLENPQAISFSPASSTFFVSQLRYDAIVSPQRPIHVFGLQ